MLLKPGDLEDIDSPRFLTAMLQLSILLVTDAKLSDLKQQQSFVLFINLYFGQDSEGMGHLCSM